MLLDDIDKDTVNFQPNYDETVSEPVVLPALIFFPPQGLSFWHQPLSCRCNVDSTKKTYDETEEVVDTFKQVYVSAEQLREIADELVSSIDYFKIQ